jgi:small subunit ribosomal protein S21|tara:strand:- start:6012 stop:6224 length:213 start_codon:yes stop_codon:yes gene_type:complete
MITIEVRNNNADKAIKMLKKKVNAEGTLKDCRDKQFYEKPTDKRRRKKAQAIRRIERNIEKLYDEKEKNY